MKTTALLLAIQAATATPSTLVFSNDQQADTVLLSVDHDNLQLTCGSGTVSNLCEIAAMKADVATALGKIDVLETTVANHTSRLMSLETAAQVPACGAASDAWITAFVSANGVVNQQTTSSIATTPIFEMRATMGDGTTRTITPLPGLNTLQAMYDMAWAPTGFETDQYKNVGSAGSDMFFLGNDHDIGAYGCSATCSGSQTSWAGTPNGLFTFKSAGGGNWGDYGSCCNNGAEVPQIPVKLEIKAACSSAPVVLTCSWLTAFDSTNGVVDQITNSAIAAAPFTELRATLDDGTTRTITPNAGLTTLQAIYDAAWAPTGFETDQYKNVGSAGSDMFFLGNDHDIGAYGCSATCSGSQTSWAGTPNGLFTFKSAGGGNWGDYGSCCNNGAEVPQVPVKLEIKTTGC